MRPLTTKMPKNFLIVAPGFFEGISKDCKASVSQFTGGQGTFFVSNSGKIGHGWGKPSGTDGNGAESVIENVTEESDLAGIQEEWIRGSVKDGVYDHSYVFMSHRGI